MKTLITGASGFIGRALLRQNLIGELHVTSRVYTSFPAGITGHFGDLGDKEFVKYLAEQQFERVIHLAWQGLPNLSEGNNLRNLKTSKQFLEILASSGVEDFHIAGSCLEYGDKSGQLDEGVIGENISDFASAKIELLEFVAGLGVAYKWYRIFYAYGPFQHDNSLLSSAFLSVKNGVALKLSNPNISRDFVYVDDVARYLALLCSKFRTKNIVRYHNLGNESVFQIGDFVKMTLSVARSLNWFQGAYPSKLVLSSTSSTDFTLQHHYDLEQDFQQEPLLTTIEKYLLWAQANENTL